MCMKRTAGNKTLGIAIRKRTDYVCGLHRDPVCFPDKTRAKRKRQEGISLAATRPSDLAHLCNHGRSIRHMVLIIPIRAQRSRLVNDRERRSDRGYGSADPPLSAHSARHSDRPSRKLVKRTIKIDLSACVFICSQKMPRRQENDVQARAFRHRVFSSIHRQSLQDRTLCIPAHPAAKARIFLLTFPA